MTNPSFVLFLSAVHQTQHRLSDVLLFIPLSLSSGSLTVSITDMRAPVVGGSGGVYALCSAHLANVVMVRTVNSLGQEHPLFL